jgi:CheY-like chemotaxis protein
MRQARDEAEKANEAKSRFLATMSHEIRTPLNALININEILLGTGLENKQEQLVRTGLNSGKVLSDIVDAILDFSQIESGNLDLVENQFSPASAASMVTDILALSARDKGIDFEVSMDSNIPGSLIGDATRIRQVLFNLVGNAIKFTNKGGVKVDVSLNSGQPEQGKVLLRFDIEDTGPGIRERDRKLLFTEFTRVGEDRRGGNTTAGTGLGLAISKKLIELMGGQIFIESKYGKGSHFWFVLPLKLTTGQMEGSSSTGWDDTQDITGLEPGELDPTNAVVLIVEDSAVNQMVIKSMLQNAGVSCIVADSGEQVLELLGTEKFELILMDVGLPGIDGIETTRRIRALDAPFADIPIIALTAYAFTEDKQRCLDAGMNDYVRKPIDRDELFAAIRRQLQAENTDPA